MSELPREDATPARSDAASPEQIGPGKRLGRHRVTALLGRGGMGAVFAAHDPELDREVAIKIVRADARDPTWRARVLREAQSLARLAHPNVVPVYDVGTEFDVLWVAMQRVEGPTLAQWLQARPPWREIVDAFVQAGRGLAAAHACGLVHRDFKPANAMRDASGRVMVLDFGLAWAPGVEGARTPTAAVPREGDDTRPGLRGASGSGRDPLAITLTASDAVVGTPAYMAPEQHAGREVDARSDQYALCVSLYEGLFGVRPFAGELDAVLAAKRDGPPSPPDAVGRELPAALWHAIARGLQPDPAARWPDVPALLAVLERTLRPPRRWPWLLGGAAVAGTIAAGLALPPVSAASSCATATAFDAVWSPARREALREAFAVSEAGRDGFARLQTRIDEATARWREQAARGCVALANGDAGSAIAATQACLDRAAIALDETLAVLATAEPNRIARAARMIEGVIEGSGCDGASTPSAGMSAPTRRDYEHARALASAGALEQVSDFADEMLARATARGDGSGEAWALLVRGGTAMDRGLPSARDDLQAARLRATEVGDDVAATTAAIKLVHLCAAEYDPACAGPSIRDAEAGIARLGDDPQLRRELLLARGDVALRAGDFDGALADYETLLQSIRASEGDHAMLEVTALRAIGTVHAQAARHEQALLRLDEADAIMAREFGERDTGRVVGLELRAGSLLALGRVDEARRAFDTALVAMDAAYGERHPHTIRMRGNLVLLLQAAGELEAAAALGQRVVALKREVFGPDDVQVAIARYNLGTVYTAMARHREAAAEYDASLELWQRAMGADHVDLAGPLAGQANAALALDRPEHALAPALRARALLARVGRAPEPTLLWDLGRAQWHAGLHAAARANVLAAREALRAAPSPSLPDDAVQRWLETHAG
ncbi:MAG: serine/threonine-protein kinase [Nannocystaceae bacterium]|nr:serine/threonine-protein kinase [Nannocystaceae bacterium]